MQQCLKQNVQTRECVKYLNKNYCIKRECSGSSNVEVTSCWGAEREEVRKASWRKRVWILQNGSEFIALNHILVHLCVYLYNRS